MTDQAASTRPVPSLLAAVPAAVGVIVSFIVAIVQYAGIDGGTTKTLSGLDSFLGLPFVAVSLIFFSLFLAWFVALASGALWRHGLWIVAIIVASLGTLFQLLAVITNASAISIVLVLAAAGVLTMTILGCRAAEAAAYTPQVESADRRTVYGIWLVIAGLAGLTAAYNLSVDKVTAILFPNVKLNCSYSILVECGTNLKSWQGSMFGFPNPLIGLGGFAVVLLVGVAVLAGIRFPRWWWVAFNIGVMGAIALIIFLIYTSVYSLATLCVWCALVWIVTIPTFWLTTIGNLKEGNLAVGERATRFWTAAYGWVPIITLVCYLVIFFIYEVHLDLLAKL